MVIDEPTARRKIASAKTESEREVGSLFLDFGFEYIAHNSEICEEDERKIGEIDLIFKFENYLFLIEVNGEKKVGSTKPNSFFSKWGAEKNIKRLRDIHGLELLKTLRIYFDCTREEPEKKSAALDHQLGQEKQNKVLYLDDLKYFKDNVKLIGKWERNDFLDYLGIEQEETSKRIPAIQFYIADVPAFAFVEKVERLLNSCYVFRRRKKDVGYQRALDENRLSAISNEIKNGKVLAFPNSIIVNIVDDQKIIGVVESPEDCPKEVKIVLPTKYCAGRVIDGQHRLLGFSGLDTKILKSYSLPVIAFQNLKSEDEVKMFIDINSKQKKIDSNLILLLKADFEWPEGSKEVSEKIAVNIFKKLNSNEPLKNRVYFGTASEKPGNKLRLTTLVSAIIKNQLVGGKTHLFQKDIADEDMPYQKIKTIFGYLKRYLRKYYFGSNTPFFVQNKGLRILFRLIRIIETNIREDLITLTLEDFFKDLGKIIDDTFREKLEDYYGDGGANKAVDLILESLKKEKPRQYAKLQRDLRIGTSK